MVACKITYQIGHFFVPCFIVTACTSMGFFTPSWWVREVPFAGRMLLLSSQLSSASSSSSLGSSLLLPWLRFCLGGVVVVVVVVVGGFRYSTASSRVRRSEASCFPKILAKSSFRIDPAREDKISNPWSSVVRLLPYAVIKVGRVGVNAWMNDDDDNNVVVPSSTPNNFTMTMVVCIFFLSSFDDYIILWCCDVVTWLDARIPFFGGVLRTREIMFVWFFITPTYFLFHFGNLRE